MISSQPYLPGFKRHDGLLESQELFQSCVAGLAQSEVDELVKDYLHSIFEKNIFKGVSGQLFKPVIDPGSASMVSFYF